MQVEPRTKTVHQTFCPICLQSGEELVIGEVYRYVGEEDKFVYGYDHAGGPLGRALTEDRVPYIATKLQPHERAPGSAPCAACDKRIEVQRKIFNAEVEAGGLHWTCEECGLFGVIVRNDSLGFCAATRGAAGVEPPNQLGVRFDRCEQHESEEDVTTMIQ